MQQWLKTQFAEGFHVYHLGLTMIPWDNKHYSSQGGKKESGFAKLNREERIQIWIHRLLGSLVYLFFPPQKIVGQD